MATSPPPKPRPMDPEPAFGKTRAILLSIFVGLFVLAIVFAWVTRDAMLHRPTMKGATKQANVGLVDETPWQTAQMLAALAVTAEENSYARQAERLADHEVDQAFAAALREANLQAQNRKLTGEAQEISQRIEQLKQTIAQDEATVQKLSHDTTGHSAGASADDSGDDTDLQIAKAQLALDSDQLTDATHDLERATGDQRAEIQSELAAREASLKEYDSGAEQNGQVTVLSVGRYRTLAGRIAAWNQQRTRLALIQQAAHQALSDAAALAVTHNRLEATANANASGQTAAQDRASELAHIRSRSTERQLLSIYDDRIQTEQQLASVYRKWAAQVELQHRIVLHLILQSIAWVFLMVVAVLLANGLVRRLVEHPALDRRRRHTLRVILELAIQIVGLLSILFLIFGTPKQTGTMLGLATAALTIALQDFILGFLGWFVLIGKRGIRVGDLVEIKDVGGEVIEIGLMFTTLLETGDLNERGYPTGRRISFMNGYAIRDKYFNFSTSEQWMTDQFVVTLPATAGTPRISERILEAIQQETAEDARMAEQEWRRGLRGDAAARLRPPAAVTLRPSGSDFAVEIRYVTRAAERAETRTRLYRRVIELLNTEPPEVHPV